MINVIDALIRDLLLANVPQLVDPAQVGFEPPDDAWRAYVASLATGLGPLNALNIYLVEVAENRKLRSNQQLREVLDGVAVDRPAPARADCHYLLTAWSPATPSPATTPTQDEHELLYQALAALEQGLPLNPSRVYPPGSPVLAAVDDLIRDSELPASVAGESFPKLAEFWGTMGTSHRWKPALHLTVTVPVRLLQQSAGFLVTTRVTEYRRTGAFNGHDVLIQIGGTVFDTTVAPRVPVSDAWVQIEAAGVGLMQAMRTDREGRFTFLRLQPGPYTLRFQAQGFAIPAQRAIDVPSPTGEYDLELV